MVHIPSSIRNLFRKFMKKFCTVVVGRAYFLLTKKVPDIDINYQGKGITTSYETSLKEKDKAVEIWLFAPGISSQELDDLNHRLDFYVPGRRTLHFINDESYKPDNDSSPILQFCSPDKLPMELRDFGERSFNIDYRYNGDDGWEWARLTRFLNKLPDLAGAYYRLCSYVQDITSKQFQKAYVFGTGPSLEKAISRDWSDGYRIVCNTIVRDKELWHHIKPHFIVAGDSRYHFGFSSFSRAFQHDLHNRLRESDTFFLYPEIFDVVVQRELYAVRDRLLPVPYGLQKKVDINLTSSYELPALGNVLPLLLLPLACTLSHDVFLWGFDGRAPSDKYFWSNSRNHNYPEKMADLMKAHPAFFEQYMPKRNSNSYVNTYMGNELDLLLKEAESRGYSFNMMHSTWTDALQKRIRIFSL